MTAVKKLAGIIFSALIIFTAILPLTVKAEKDFSNCKIYDEYGLFKESKLDELDSLLKQTAEEIDMSI